jgi:ABC-type uncharacterized transport system permease subunit
VDYEPLFGAMRDLWWPQLRKRRNASFAVIVACDAYELAEILIGERGANPPAEQPGRAIGAKPHAALDLRNGHVTFVQHEMDRTKPFPQRNFRVLENRPDQNRETIAFRIAGLALPGEVAEMIDF